MNRSATELRRDALKVWQAGVASVRSDKLVRQALRVEGRTLLIGNEESVGWDKRSEVPPSANAQSGRWDCASLVPPYRLSLDSIRRIVVVGAGKAGAGMAEAVENVLGPQLMAEKQLTGWVNVPADCVRPLREKGGQPPFVRSRAPTEGWSRAVPAKGDCPPFPRYSASICTPPERPASMSPRPRASPAHWKSCGSSNRLARKTSACA